MAIPQSIKHHFGKRLLMMMLLTRPALSFCTTSLDPGQDLLSNNQEYHQDTYPNTGQGEIKDGVDHAPTQTAGNECLEDAEGHVELSGKIYTGTETCTATTSITAAQGVLVSNLAQVNYQAPLITLLPGFSVETGGLFNAVPTSPISEPDTTYVATSGTDNATCGDITSPCRTINHGGSQMNPGDTLVIQPGIYNEDIVNTTDNAVFPSGSAEQYTVIKGEQYGQVIITGRFEVGIDGSSDQGFESDYYLAFENLKFDSTFSKSLAGHYIKVQKSIFKSGPANGNANVVGTGTTDFVSSHILLEDIVSYGQGGRYNILFFNTDYSICRRCIIRHDGGWTIGGPETFNPEGGIVIYDSNFVEIQNSLAIDSVQDSMDEFMGGFVFNANSILNRQMTDVAVKASLSLDNSIGNSLGHEGSTDMINVSVSDFVAAGNPSGVVMAVQAATSLDNMAIIQNGADGVASYANGVSATVNHSILYDYGEEKIRAGSGNISDNNNPDYSPYTNGYLYLPRVETGSQLATDGVGPSIINKTGADGTVHGEPDYNSLQSESLWPWPMEAEIRAEICNTSYLSQYRSGRKNSVFCDSGKSISRYVWEYLGNACPTGMCNSASP